MIYRGEKYKYTQKYIKPYTNLMYTGVMVLAHMQSSCRCTEEPYECHLVCQLEYSKGMVGAS